MRWHFFENYFDFKTTEVKGDNVIAILKGDDNFTLVLMSAASSKLTGAVYPEAFHIGFMVDDVDQVQAIYQKLKAGGIELGHEPRKIRDSFGFYLNFENIMIEVGHYM